MQKVDRYPVTSPDGKVIKTDFYCYTKVTRAGGAFIMKKADYKCPVPASYTILSRVGVVRSSTVLITLLP